MIVRQFSKSLPGADVALLFYAATVSRSATRTT